jgi:hypothetical protein
LFDRKTESVKTLLGRKIGETSALSGDVPLAAAIDRSTDATLEWNTRYGRFDVSFDFNGNFDFDVHGDFDFDTHEIVDVDMEMEIDIDLDMTLTIKLACESTINAGSFKIAVAE